MKKYFQTKFWQAVALLVIVIIEIIGFNNQWKYCLMGKINPSWKISFLNNMEPIKIILVTLFILIIYLLWRSLKKDNIHPLFIVFLIKGFQVKGSDIIGIFNVVFTLCSIAWIGIELYVYTLNGILNACIYAEFMLLYPLIVACFLLPHSDPSKKNSPKVLISGLSFIMEDKLQEFIMGMEKEEFKNKWKDPIFFELNKEGKLVIKKINNVVWGPWGNLDPIRKSIIKYHDSLEQIYLISSSEVTNNIKSWKEHLKPENLINEYISKEYPDSHVIVETIQENISGNDMTLTSVGLENLVRKILANNHKDHDIIFNITGGTAAISGAMILKAIPLDRKAEYANQQDGLLYDVPLSIYDVKDLWNELLEKVG